VKKLKCPNCGENPIVFDSKFNILVCSHCGTVIDEHPILINPISSLEEHYGSYIITRKYIDIALKHMKIVHDDVSRLTPFITSRTIEKIVELVDEYCNRLNLDKAICESARERARASTLKIVKTQGRQLIKVNRTGKLIAVACIYISLLEYSVPTSLRRLCSKLGVRSGDVYRLIYKFRDVFEYKHSSQIKLYVNKIYTALLKKLDVETASKIRDLALKITSENPQVTGSPLLVALAAVVIAFRRLGVKVNVKALCRELHLAYYQRSRIYEHIQRFEQLMKTRKSEDKYSE
jgi:transcription initiation factor TFIIIB Brf1 subunit/transcription initiation factor TFIIB